MLYYTLTHPWIRHCTVCFGQYIAPSRLLAKVLSWLGTQLPKSRYSLDLVWTLDKEQGSKDSPAMDPLTVFAELCMFYRCSRSSFKSLVW